jgi:DNA gyrase subunit A
VADLFGEKVLNVPIEEEVKKSYLDYSMSVIIGRALPDIRDGLKPVHRRILYAMNELGSLPDRPYKKCARIVGETLGKYHPHGDASVYDALVRMAQTFSLRHPLVDGHGNFGSIDGDMPAAMRYTEARLSNIALELLEGLDENTVDFTPNFDNTLKEPVVLPARIPNLLINGSSGIAVGMATNIPPHNLREIIDALVYIIDNEIMGEQEVTTDELLNFIKGPDFPTGGYIMGNSGIKEYFETGRGSITIRSKWHIEEIKHKKVNFVITEIPFEVNKASLVEKIADLAKNKKIRGIEDIRDESDRDGVRIVIKLSEDTNVNVFENLLKIHTPFEIKYGVMLIGIKDNAPKVYSVKQLLKEFLLFREQILVRQTQFELDKAQKHLEILEGLSKAIQKIDEVIVTIKSSKDSQEALLRLLELLSITDTQAKAILDMRLARLTALENTKINDDILSTKKDIERFNEILTRKEILWEEIKKDLQRIKDKFGNNRKSELKFEEGTFVTEDLIEDKETIISITNDGYIKRVPFDTFRLQRRGGKGVLGQSKNAEDYAKEIIVTTTKNRILFFTNKGKVYALKAYEIPETEREAKGIAIHRILKLYEDEVVSSVLALEKESKVKNIVFITKKGIVKKTSIEQFESVHSSGKIAITLDEDDRLVSSAAAKDKDEVLITTAKGQTIRFNNDQIRSMGRTARGVIGIRISGEDFVVDGEVVKNEDRLLLITTNGYGKRLCVKDIRKVRRGSKGVKAIKLDKASGPLQAVKVVEDKDWLFIMSKNGNVIKININEVPVMSKYSRGVRIIKFREEGDSVSSITTSQNE